MQECPVCGVCYDQPLTVCPADDAALFEAISGSRVIDGKYQLERRIGYGGMGVVYRARHLALQRPFAVKIIQQRVGGEERFLQSFRREAEALGQLEHPHIVDVTDFGVDAREGGLAYLVMEYLEGITLDEHCGRGSLPLEEALPLLSDVAEAVDFAHGRGFLHRDLKPANVFLAKSGAGERVVKVLDFGLARREADLAEAALPIATPSPATLPYGENEATERLDGVTAFAETIGPEQTRERGVVGTIGYIAPELLRGARGGRAADLYAFGVLIYRVLTGTLPYDSVGTDYLHRQVSEDPIAPSSRGGLPHEADAPILALLDRNPARRPAAASTSIADLRRACEAAGIRRWRSRERPRRAAAAAGIALLAALLVAPLARLGVIRTIEGKTVNARVKILPRRAPDPRITVILFDEATVRTSRATLSERADEFGHLLARALDSGASGIAVDLLLPPRWSDSRPFAELLLRRSSQITLAAQSTADGFVIGPEPLGGLVTVALGPEKTASMFGFAELDVDRDGMTRSGRLFFVDAAGRRWPSFAAHAARHVSQSASAGNDAARFLIDWRVDPREYRVISWKDFGPLLDADPDAFRGKLLLAGGAFAGSGDELHRSPLGPLAGPLLQAAAIDTILARFPLRSTGTLPASIPAAIVSAAIAFQLLTRRRRTRAAWVGAGLVALLLVATVLLARFALLIVPVAAALVALLISLAVAVGVRAIMPPLPRSGD